MGGNSFAEELKLRSQYIEILKKEGYSRGIEYVIQLTDSVAGIAKRFGVDLHKLVSMNPWVCTPAPQAGLELIIPIDHLSTRLTVKEGKPENWLVLPDGELFKYEELVSVT